MVPYGNETVLELHATTIDEEVAELLIPCTVKQSEENAAATSTAVATGERAVLGALELPHRVHEHATAQGIIILSGTDICVLLQQLCQDV